MEPTLNAEQQAALAQAKELAKEIEKTVAESLSIQNVGGYVVRNQALKLNALLEVVSPTEEDEDEEVVPSVTDVIQPNA